LAVLLLLPVALLLFAVGFTGYLYARSTMLETWKESAVLKLQRAAHQIDMRLTRPMEWIQMFHETGGDGSGRAASELILERLRRLEGVARVDLRWQDQTDAGGYGRGPGMMMRATGMMRFQRGRISNVTSPRFDVEVGQETVDLISELRDEASHVVGVLTVVLRFEYLMQDIHELGWWQSDLACLVDDAGRFLAHTQGLGEGRKRLGETDNPVELVLLERMQKNKSGTILGPGHPPRQVAGYYRLRNAPWTVFLMAPGDKVLAPIIRFRFYYFLAGVLCIAVIVVLIRSVAGSMAQSVTAISEAAERVAAGNYGEPLDPGRNDEIGQLATSFNTMVAGLKERDFISNTFGRYVDHEIARELMRRPEAARLGGEKRKVVILMSDLRNFTPLSEALTPEQTIHLLNQYFSRMIDIIQRHQGIIVDFFGDALLVFFDPLDQPIAPSVRRAVSCAVAMQKEVARFTRENREAGMPELHMGIGIHAGEVVVGNIGSPARAKYGIVGSAVNLTQRIQSVAEPCEIAVSHVVYGQAGGGLGIKRTLDAELKGVSAPVKLFILDADCG